MKRIKLFESFEQEAINEYASNPAYAPFVDELKDLIKTYQGKKLSKDAMYAAAQEIMTGVDSDELGEEKTVVDDIQFSLENKDADLELWAEGEKGKILIARQDGGKGVFNLIFTEKDDEINKTLKKIGLSDKESFKTMKELWTKITQH